VAPLYDGIAAGKVQPSLDLGLELQPPWIRMIVDACPLTGCCLEFLGLHSAETSRIDRRASFWNISCRASKTRLSQSDRFLQAFNLLENGQCSVGGCSVNQVDFESMNSCLCGGGRIIIKSNTDAMLNGRDAFSQCRVRDTRGGRDTRSSIYMYLLWNAPLIEIFLDV
jgi:hypothetical protein